MLPNPIELWTCYIVGDSFSVVKFVIFLKQTQLTPDTTKCFQMALCSFLTWCVSFPDLSLVVICRAQYAVTEKQYLHGIQYIKKFDRISVLNDQQVSWNIESPVVEGGSVW